MRRIACFCKIVGFVKPFCETFGAVSSLRSNTYSPRFRSQFRPDRSLGILTMRHISLYHIRMRKPAQNIAQGGVCHQRAKGGYPFPIYVPDEILLAIRALSSVKYLICW